MNYFSKPIVFFISVLVFTACNQTKQETISDTDSTIQVSVVEKDGTQKEQEEIVEQPAFTIDIISEFPPEIDGCSCYFSKNEADFKKKKYIYVDNYKKIAFVKINGKLIKFERISQEKIENAFYKSNYKSLDKDQSYLLETNIKMEEQNGDETFFYIGMVKVSDKDGRTTLMQTFIGECGC